MRTKDRLILKKWHKRLHPARKRNRRELKLWAARNHHLHLRYMRRLEKHGLPLPEEYRVIREIGRTWRSVERMAKELRKKYAAAL